MDASARWFIGAPAAKVLSYGTVLAYLAVHSRRLHDVFTFDSAKVWTEPLRFWSSKLIFASTSELIIGTALLSFLARKFEREMGSRKFVLFCVLVNLIAIATELALVSSVLVYPYHIQYAGPYPLLGALFLLFHWYAPRMYPRFFGVFGFTFSEKAFYYLWFLQVVGSGGKNTIFSSLNGILSCVLYNSFLTKFDIPDVVATYLSSIGDRLADDPSPIFLPNAAATRPHHPVLGGGVNAAAIPRGPAVAVQPTRPVRVEPDPDAIEQLTNMGFQRQQVMEALQYTNNDVQRAADRLLMQSGHM